MPCFPNLFKQIHQQTGPTGTAEGAPASNTSEQSVHQDAYKPVQVFVQAKKSLPQGKKAFEHASHHGPQPATAANGPASQQPSKVDKAEQTERDAQQDMPRLRIECAPKKWRKADSIGNGSFGTVHLGLNADTGELMAIKEVLLNADGVKSKEAVEQLEREVALLSRLQHPNIVQYLGTSRDGTSLLIFLEYVPGGSIATMISRFGPLPEEVVRIYTRQLLLGLAYLHSQRTVHRDVKGANLLVEKTGRIKLADFGMAKQMVEQASFTKSFKGSAFWMAPEVIRQLGHGVAADIWSVGCTVLEMATGKPPWSQCSTQVQAIFKIASSQELPSIPESLSADASEFILLCLQRNPATRPTAEQLLHHPFVNLSSVPLPTALNPSDYAPLLHAGRSQGAPGAAGRGPQSATDGTAWDGAGSMQGQATSKPVQTPGNGAEDGASPSQQGGGSVPSGAAGSSGDDRLAAMLLGPASSVTRKKCAVDDPLACDELTGLPAGCTLGSRPPMFMVRGLLSMPPLKVLDRQQLPAAMMMPLPSQSMR